MTSARRHCSGTKGNMCEICNMDSAINQSRKSYPKEEEVRGYTIGELLSSNATGIKGGFKNDYGGARE